MCYILFNLVEIMAILSLAYLLYQLKTRISHYQQFASLPALSNLGYIIGTGQFIRAFEYIAEMTLVRDNWRDTPRLIPNGLNPKR